MLLASHGFGLLECVSAYSPLLLFLVSFWVYFVQLKYLLSIEFRFMMGWVASRSIALVKMVQITLRATFRYQYLSSVGLALNDVAFALHYIQFSICYCVVNSFFDRSFSRRNSLVLHLSATVVEDL